MRVEVELITSPSVAHIQDMSASAKYLTNNEKSVVVYIPDENPGSVVAEFTIDKAKQADVVDKIARRFRIHVGNYSQSRISFPRTAASKARRSKNQYTPKQGQYLAFIYHYTKLNGYPPAEADMQRYFKTTPPSVHGMVVQLEKMGFIEKKPNEPRTIRLLLPRKDLPDLE